MRRVSVTAQGGIAPTGKQVTVYGETISRFANGKIVGGSANWNALGLMQQLAVVPELARTKAAAK